MSGRHAAPATPPAGLRRLGVAALTTGAVTGAFAAVAGPALAAPAAAPAASAPTVKPPPKIAGADAQKVKGAPSMVTGRLAVAEARKHIGAPYRYGANGPSAFDCSGLTRYVYNKQGISLPHSAAQQQRSVHPVAKNAMQPGDLIFQGKPAHHVAIFAGNGKMITAPESGEAVKLDDLPSGSWTAGRPV